MSKVCLSALAGLFAFVSTVHATLLREKFATDPAADGWQVYGDTSLFSWDSTNRVLAATWNSDQTNSFFFHPLDRTYSMADGFCLVLNLQLNDVALSGFQTELAAGLFRFTDATNADYMRSEGTQPNVCEFDYFPPDGYGDEVSESASLAGSTFIGGYATFFFAYDNQPVNTDVNYHVVLVHQPGSATISAEIFTNGQVMTVLPKAFDDGVVDFQLDTLSVSSYLAYGSGLLAHGTVSDIAFASPLPVGAIQTAGPGQVELASDTNWVYTLEQSSDLVNWTSGAVPLPGNGTNLVLQATNVPATAEFYRVRADLP